MKKIVITGGLGFIGTELCKIYSGYSWFDHITVIDNRFISERVNQIRNWNMDFFQGDILDKDFIHHHCHGSERTLAARLTQDLVKPLSLKIDGIVSLPHSQLMKKS